MLIILMHNNQDYLEYIMQLARKEGVADFTIIKSKSIGTRLIGGDTSYIFSKGTALDAYDKAFVAVVKGEEKTKHFLEVMEQDSYLDRLNIQNKGFICTVPFHYIKHVELEQYLKKEEKGRMKITDFLKEDRILLNLKASHKEEAIKEVAGLLGNAREISNFDLFLKDVFERESLSTTGIGNNIAIPHTRTDSAKEFIIAVGRSPDGVDFGALDDKPVKLIFLMGTPKEKGLNDYLRILAHLTRLLQKEDFKKGLLYVSSSKDMIEAFRKIER